MQRGQVTIAAAERTVRILVSVALKPFLDKIPLASSWELRTSSLSQLISMPSAL